MAMKGKVETNFRGGLIVCGQQRRQLGEGFLRMENGQ